MSKIYARIQNDYRRLRHYNYLILLIASIVTAIVIMLEVVNYLEDKLQINSYVLNVLTKLGEHSELIGASIAIMFLCCGVFIWLRLALHDRQI